MNKQLLKTFGWVGLCVTMSASQMMGQTVSSVQLNPTSLGGTRALNAFGSGFSVTDTINVGPSTCSSPTTTLRLTAPNETAVTPSLGLTALPSYVTTPFAFTYNTNGSILSCPDSSGCIQTSATSITLSGITLTYNAASSNVVNSKYVSLGNIVATGTGSNVDVTGARLTLNVNSTPPGASGSLTATLSGTLSTGLSNATLTFSPSNTTTAYGTLPGVTVGASVSTVTFQVPACIRKIQTTFNSSTNISGSLPGTYIPTPGIYDVLDMTSNGSLSNSTPLTVGLLISSVTPAAVAQNSLAPIITVIAEGGLTASSKIYFNGQQLTNTVFDSANQVHAQLSQNNVGTLGTFPITVQDPTNGTSNSLTFTVGPVITPSITNVTPTLVTAGDSSAYIVITGANFQQDGSGYTGARVIMTISGGGAPQVIVPGTNTGSVITFTLSQAQLANPISATFAISNVTDGRTSNAVSFVVIARPAITSLSLNPSAVGGNTALNVNGLNFSPTDKVLIGPPGCNTASCLQVLNTTYNSSTVLTASIPGSFINTPGFYVVYVQNALGALSIPATLTIQLTLTSVNPGSVVLNMSPAPTIIVQAVGGLTQGAVILFNGQALTGTVVDSPTQAHAPLSANNVGTLGTFPITVQSGSFVSNALPFTVFTPQTPTITNVTPSGAFAGDNNTMITITGTNFRQDSGQFTGARVVFTAPAGSATLVPSSNSGTVITVNVPQNLLATAGIATIVVTNVSDNRASTPPVNFPIRTRPVIISIAPNPTAANVGVALSITGQTYVTGDTVLIGSATCVSICPNPVAVPTTFNSGTSLTANIPGNLIPATGPYFIYIQTSFGGLSAPATLNVNLSLLSMTPTFAAQASTPPVLTVQTTGGLVQGVSVILFNGQSLTTTVDSATQAHATLSAANVATLGVFPVTIQNGTGTGSNSLPFTVGTPLTPGIISANPNGAIAGSPDTLVTITGTNFNSDARVLFTAPGTSGATNLTPLPSSVTATSLIVTVPASLLTVVGTATIAVQNVSANTTSNSIGFPIRRLPSISQLTPNPTGAGVTTALTVQGLNFVNGDTILIGAQGCNQIGCLQALNTTFNSANNITGSLPGSFIPNQGPYSVFVRTSFGALSDPLTLTVTLGITSLSPASATQNTGPITLTVNSTGGFTPSATVYFAGSPLATTYVSPTQVTAVLTTTNLAVAGTFFVYVQNTGAAASNTLGFVVVAQGQILSISPNTAFAGTGPVTIQISGTNFGSTDVVRLGGNTLQTTYNSPSSLTASIPANLLASAGNFAVTVQNALGSNSNAINFAVTLQITGLSPASFNAGGSVPLNLTATLTGGVTANTVLNYGGTQLSAISFTATSITVRVPSSLTASAGTPAVFAKDGANQSNTVNHLILGLLTLTSISPNFVDAGTNGVSVTLTGIGFDSESIVTLNGTQAANFAIVSSTSATVQVPANLIASVGTVQIGVTDSGGRTSNQLPLAVLTPLTITSLNPATAAAGSPAFTLTVNGTGFDTGSVIRWASNQLATTFTSGSQLVAIVPASLLTSTGTVCVSVQDSRGRISPCATFTVVNPLTITSLNPSSGPVGVPVALLINGTGFPFVTGSLVASFNGNTATVFFGTSQLTGTIVSATQIAVNILPTVAGLIPVSIQVPDGRTSNTLTFSVAPPFSTAPQIISVTPSVVTAPSPAQTITLSGINFVNGSAVLINGTSVSTTYVNANTLTATLPAFSSGNVVAIQVINPGGQSSNIFYIQVNGSNRPNAITLISITPSSIAQGSPAFVLTANGTGFVPGATITFGSTLLQTVYVGSTQITTTVPASLVANAGQFPVWVTNPDGTSSPALLFTVINSKPVITSLVPPSISAGAAQFTLTVNGQGFKTGATVSFAGVNVTTNFGGPAQLTATIPASLVAVAGNVPVVVTNPDGVASDPATFVITPFSLTSISPATATVGDAGFTMTLTGSGFLSGASATFNGSTVATTFVNASTLTASIPASALLTPGTVNVTVINADSAVSGALPFIIKGGITLTAINPSTATQNSKSVSITATGTGFVAGATVNFAGTAIATTFGSATSVRGTIPEGLLTSKGSFDVTVSNPNGDTSNALSFTITDPLPLPTITSISPATATVGSANLAMTVTGTNFVQGSTVVFGGSNSATTFVSATQLRATVTAGQLSQAGTFTVVVTNPDGNSSNSVDFIVVTPLSITSLSPTALPVSGSNSTLVIIGSGIVNGATVQFGTTTLTADTTTSTRISVTVPANLLAASGQVNITVTNPDGTISNALSLIIVGLPTININATVAAGTANQVTLTLADPAPADLTGTLVMTFASNASNTPANYTDPAQQFASGGTSVNFTIAKGAKTAVIPGNGAFSPGTVSGTLTFTLTKLLSGIDNVLSTPPPFKSFIIDRAAPVISVGTVKILNSTSAGFTVEVIGFSTSREVTRVNLTFTSTASIDGGGTVSVDVTTAFNNYFNSQAGQLNGGAFKLDLPFTISGADANVITAVTVSLTNSIGTSAGVSGGR